MKSRRLSPGSSKAKGPVRIPGLFSYFFFCPSDLMRSSNFRNSAVSSSTLLEGRFWKGITSDMVEPPLGARPRCMGILPAIAAILRRRSLRWLGIRHNYSNFDTAVEDRRSGQDFRNILGWRAIWLLKRYGDYLSSRARFSAATTDREIARASWKKCWKPALEPAHPRCRLRRSRTLKSRKRVQAQEPLSRCLISTE